MMVVEVIFRDEDNYIDIIADSLIDLSQKKKDTMSQTRSAALKLADSADWEHFIVYYKEAYCKALQSSIVRLSAVDSNNK